MEMPVYNISLKQCVPCPSRQVWDSVTRQCRDRVTTGLCPPEKPLYDQALLTCKACPRNTTYNN